MYDDSTYTPTLREEQSPSGYNLRSQEMNATTGTLNNLSVSSAVQPTIDGTHFNFPEICQHLMAPVMQGAFQDPLQGNHGGVYSGGPLASPEPNIGNPTPCQGGGNVSAITGIPYSGSPTVPPNVPSGQASNPCAGFRVSGHPPTLPLRDLYPGIFARLNAQGTPGFLWEMCCVELDYQNGDDARVIIHFRKIVRSP